MDEREMMLRNTLVWGSLLLISSGCGGDAGEGFLEFTVYGEDFIEEEIPAAPAAGEEGFVDGWSVRFSKFLICLGDITVANQAGEEGASDEIWRIHDLHRPGPHQIVSFADVEARRWDRVSFAIEPAGDHTLAGNASDADLELMQAGGYSIFAEGVAEKGGDSYSFAWGFDTSTSYSDCHHDDYGEGVVVPAGGTDIAEITIHGDHLFYDDLQSADTVLRFDAMAGADGDGDGVITLEELSFVDLTMLSEGSYGTGGDGTVEDLGAFVTALTRTLGHWRGEGHCHSGATHEH